MEIQNWSTNLGIGALEVGDDAAPPLQAFGASLRLRRYLRRLRTHPWHNHNSFPLPAESAADME